MAVSSMTGFARAAGSGGTWRWTFELKTVNAKGLDIRLRMPAPFDRAEGEARARLAKALARGTCFATLSAQREGATATARIDLAALELIAVAARAAAVKAGLAPPTMDGLLALRGVLEAADVEDDEAAVTRPARARSRASMRRSPRSPPRAGGKEGRSPRCSRTCSGQLPGLVEAADANPARRPEAVRERLAQSIQALMASSRGFDENRLHQEAILLAAKADIREELDRLKTHVAAARALIEEGGPIGRRLDFLSQELGARGEHPLRQGQ